MFFKIFAGSEWNIFDNVALVGVFGEGLRQEQMNMLITQTDKKRVSTIVEEDEMNSLNKVDQSLEK